MTNGIDITICYQIEQLEMSAYYINKLTI